jgi:hypothetical protein
MSTLAISTWSGTKREVHFVGFNRDHTACFIRDEENTRRAITLRMPSLFKLHFRENPIGQNGSPPVEITRAVLHVPASFLSEAEKQKFDDPKSVEVECARIIGDDMWKVVTSHKCWLRPKHNKKLSKLLHEEMKALRRSHAVRKLEVDNQIAALPPGQTNRAEELRNMLRSQFATSCSGQNGSSKFISIFDVTLEMVRHGWGGIYEKVLEREWADDCGINLDDIPGEAASFRAWLERVAYNARQTMANLNTWTVETGVCLKLDPWQWDVLEAAVQYEIRFADGSRSWLDDVNERDITDPQEIEDFDRLEEATEIRGDGRLSLDEVCHGLTVKWNGQTKSISKRGLRKVCKKAGVPFKFPMHRNIVKKLEQHRAKGRRSRNERLKRHNTKVRQHKAGLMH